MIEQLLIWIGFGAFVLAMLALDLGVFHRKSHTVGMKEALTWSAVWIALALLFNAGVRHWRGHDKGLEFLTGYLVELSLSVDNLFVFLLLFAYFKVPAQYQQEHEQVVHAQRQFDQVAGEEFQSLVVAAPVPDARVEDQRQRDPHRAPGQRLLHADGVRLAVEHAQIQRQHRQHERAETNPNEKLFTHTCAFGDSGIPLRPVTLTASVMRVAGVPLGRSGVRSACKRII